MSLLEADAAVLIIAQSHRHRSHPPPPGRRARQRAAGSMRERKGELGLSLPSPWWFIIIAIAAREGEQDSTPTCLPTGSIAAPFPTVGSATAALLTAAEHLPPLDPSLPRLPPTMAGSTPLKASQWWIREGGGEVHSAAVKGEEERRWESATVTSQIIG